MIHVRTRSSFDYLLEAKSKQHRLSRIIYRTLSIINPGDGTLDRSSPFRHHHFCLVIAHSLDLVFKENLRQ